MTNTVEILSDIAQAIYDKKGNNILALDISGSGAMSDFIVIAEGNVDRHVLALASEVEKTLDEKGEKPLRKEGRKNGDWVVLDYGEITIHLFMPGMREKYQLEQLWDEAKIVELSFNIP